MSRRLRYQGDLHERMESTEGALADRSRSAWIAVVILVFGAGLAALSLTIATTVNRKSTETMAACEEPVDVKALRQSRLRRTGRAGGVRIEMLSEDDMGQFLVTHRPREVDPWEPPVQDDIEIEVVEEIVVEIEADDVLDTVRHNSPLVYVGPMGGSVSSGRHGGRASVRTYGGNPVGKYCGRAAPADSSQVANTESYDLPEEEGYLSAKERPLSTFSIDVDTASYSNVRRLLNGGQTPPSAAVRLEEMINYFDYDYPQPTDRHPFSVNTEMGPCPWNPNHYLVRIGLKGKEIKTESRPAANLVFLLDVSGSMSSNNKLPLVKRSLRLLTEKLTERDRVSIVVYAGAAGMVLPSTTADNKEAIIDALEKLNAGGSTNGGEGIKLAYETAKNNLIPNGVNRVVLATDGDFNVGITDNDELLEFIAAYAKEKVYLSVLGFGMGNYKDSRMETLSNKGNGNYAYIDTLDEAKKVLVEQMSGTLVTIAKDVKIQVEFNPAKVAGYRLIGYDNRRLKKEDFNDDKKDAGEIGAGHCVTAFYEIVPAGVEAPKAGTVDELKYQTTLPITADAQADNEIMTVKLRYKPPTSDTSVLMTQAVAEGCPEIMDMSRDFKFAVALTQFGLLLRDSEWKGASSYKSIRELASAGISGAADATRRQAFLKLIDQAERLKPQTVGMK